MLPLAFSVRTTDLTIKDGVTDFTTLLLQSTLGGTSDDHDPVNVGGFMITQSLDGKSLMLNYTVVSEPAEWGMLGTGLLGMILLRRRRLS